MDAVGVLMKEFRRRSDAIDQFFPYLVAARAYGRSNRGEEIFRAAAEFGGHRPNPGSRNPGHGSAPAGMKGGDHALPRVDQQQRHAVGHLDSERQAGAGRDHSVRGHRLSWAFERNHGRSVNLLKGGERGFRGKRTQQQGAIAEHALTIVGRGKTKIQSRVSVDSGDASGAARKAVLEPSVLAPGRYFDQVERAHHALDDTAQTFGRAKRLPHEQEFA